VRSQDNGWGVRSLSFLGDVMTVGGGAGKLSFLDMRTLQYIEMPESPHRRFLRVSDGWLRRDELYRTYFADAETPNAVYTHCYDPSGSRLFVAGGPLSFGLCGTYAALWQ